MTTPTLPPAERGPQTSHPPVDPGRCLNGTTEFTFEPCEVVSWKTEPPPIPTTAVLAVAPSEPMPQALPVTGGFEAALVAVGVCLVAAGAACRRLARL